MKRIHIILLLLSSFFVFVASGQSNQGEADKILGIWLTGSKKGKVEVYKCGDKYCGKIVWLRDPNYEDGSPKIDKNNEDEGLNKRPIMGLNILSDFEYDEDLEWEEGTIYDPDNGKTYSCVINMDEDDPNKLDVRGYIGFSLIGRTDVWIRTKLD